MNSHSQVDGGRNATPRRLRSNLDPSFTHFSGVKMTVDVSAVGANPFPQAMSGASGGRAAPPQQKMTTLFSAIDQGDVGSITRDQFKKAFAELKPPAAFQAAGENKVWNALDKDGTGRVSKADFVDGMKKLMVDLRGSGSAPAGDESLRSQTALAGTDAVNTFYV